MELAVYGAALLFLLLLWVFYRGLTGSWDLALFVQGADGRASTSKFQWLLWTIVVLFAYVALLTARAMHGYFGALGSLPSNVLIAMGLSSFTAIAAKQITTANVANGQAVKPPKIDQPPNPGELLSDDSGYPELSKMQLLAWTLLAIGIYLGQVVTNVSTTLAATTASSLPPLPDIDPTLMVLMGLGQAAYLGKKLTTNDTPRLTSITPGRGTPPLAVTLRGQAFGSTRDGSQIIVNNNIILPVAVSDADWTDTSVQFTIPAGDPTDPSGQAWAVGSRLDIGLIVSGRDSANTLPFIVDKAAAPTPGTAAPAPAGPVAVG